MRPRLLIAAGLALVLLAGAAVALASVRRDPCAGFRFSRAEWRTADGNGRERIGERIVRCHTFAHATRATVYGALGGGAQLSGEWHLSSGSYTFTYTSLRIRFGADGRVARAWLVRGTD